MSFLLTIFQGKTTVVENSKRQILMHIKKLGFLPTVLTAFHSVLPIELHFFQVGDTIVIILIDLRQMSGALYQQ